MDAVATILLVGKSATRVGALAARLEFIHHCKVVGIVAQPKWATSIVEDQSVDILLVDANGADSTWNDQIRGLKSERPNMRIMAVGYPDRHMKRCLADEIIADGVLFGNETHSEVAERINWILRAKPTMGEDSL